ncbi:xanthine dehydrogenase small subunit [Aureimonas fodinaquatilis]|uniref:Xanthine dehydrogenase small subunit n=1 Tax=Aureimonas fodinaquatilis TaxID=2565783 RepID=A0A5B0DSR5_9HYPH|nr:xanthine dehydrogenase small subunit [Aureimonas fodinaquatilis]KAA0968630.1 xanthine dehydrogenase small subunit [Aureimonas fodinaquatilis]
MAQIRFLLNGQERTIDGAAPTTTVLNYLRYQERLTGAKEGCAEGDCGACTVLLSEPDGMGGLRRRAVNACILFVPALHGRAVETVEALAQDGVLNPLQMAMVDHHASQCGFCTPGFVMQLQASWLNGALSDRQSVKDAISGNLCRCTGYGPIIDAGLALAEVERADSRVSDAALAQRLADIRGTGTFTYETAEGVWHSPENVDDLADLYAAAPDAVLVAGASDVGLWVTKQHRALPVLIDISRVEDLRFVEEGGGSVFFGAAVTHEEARPRLALIHPALDELMRRFAGSQVRNCGTIGGNIANGSPIGDLPPALIALGATLHLRSGDEARQLLLEEFFIDYGKQDRAPGEFVAAVEVPELELDERFACYKISKRMDSDISAVLAAFRLRLDGDVVSDVTLAFGGMAGTPRRARNAEAALIGRVFDNAAVAAAQAALAADFQPLSDMRASANYRLTVAGNCLQRFQMELAGVPTRIAEVA